jgi:hypothetical protein
MTPSTHQHEPSISGARALFALFLLLGLYGVGAAIAIGALHA